MRLKRLEYGNENSPLHSALFWTRRSKWNIFLVINAFNIDEDVACDGIVNCTHAVKKV
jgi:hypothetical protein